MKVGFIGLGVMGSVMVSNLFVVGYFVMVWNCLVVVIELLVLFGVWVVSIFECVVFGEVVCLMLVND